MTETTALDSQTPVAAVPRSPQWVVEVERLFRERNPGAYFVLPRVVRRVLQNELEIASPWVPPPHRKSCVVDRDRLLWFVARDELGVDDNAFLPQRLILIARPEEDRLEKFSREDLLRYYWRLLFHARIDLELGLQVASGRMTVAELRQRIEALGQTQFDEIRSVLKSEQMLPRPDDLRQVYAEFVAVYYELQAFAPALLPLYFPSLDSDEAVRRAIGADCDAAAILEATRPGDLAPNAAVATLPSPSAVEETLLEGSPISLASRSPRKYAALVRRAKRLRVEGNNVRAALVRRQAIDVAPLDQMREARNELMREIEYLVLRLQVALELTDDDVRPWLTMCARLLPAARRGFWNANARLLYDLQQVCLDHEQEIYKVDLFRWATSLRKQPLKRPLFNQRAVMMSKHLRSAALRVPVVQIDAEGRRELSELVHAAADAAGQILRKRLEPLVADSLTEAGFIPNSVVERVAFHKVMHELLDRVVERGFLTLGVLRDTIARNQLKMSDLADAREFVAGDPLLRADKRLADRLDGVYQRGPFYLRWMQRLTSLAYGIPKGRVVTKYLALPLGLAFLTLMALEEVAHHVVGHSATDEAHVAAASPVSSTALVAGDHGAAAEALTNHPAARHYLVYSHWHLLWLSCFIFALLHIPKFRYAVVWFLKRLWKIVKIAFVKLPRRIVKFPLVEWLLKSFPMMLFRRFLFAPLLATAVLWKLLPAVGAYQSLNHWWGLAIFLVALLVLNSRVGRDTEELTREFFSRMWYRIRTHLVVGLFTLIVEAFHWLMDGLERVLYAVDEWLRFRSGESAIVLGFKAVLGLAWAFVHGVIRFCVTLLIEPQINPIKHFPVVTVSHKLLLPLAYTSHPGTVPSFLASIMLRVTPMSIETANLVMATVVWGIPGIFGFLAWELKENWKLYAANRSHNLGPVPIGHHGETLLWLLRPGFHSGTIPKLFARRRRAARQTSQDPNINKQARYAEKLSLETERLRHFFDRELIGLLRESQTFRERPLSIADVELATNRISILLSNGGHPDETLRLEFAEQSGWLIAGVTDPGWLRHLSDADRAVFRNALAGLYKLGSVDLVREQIESQLAAPPLPVSRLQPGATPAPNERPAMLVSHPYDIAATGLVVWPHWHYESEVHYAMEDRPMITPRPRSLARAAGLPPLPLAAIVYREHALPWADWHAYWEAEQNPSDAPSSQLLPEVELLKRL